MCIEVISNYVIKFLKNDFNFFLINEYIFKIVFDLLYFFIEYKYNL